jgi:rare lipoprotein A
MTKAYRFKISSLLLIMTILLLSGCATTKRTKTDGPPKRIPANLLRTPDAVPKLEPLSRYGNRFGKNGRSNSYVALKKRYHVLPTSRGYKARGMASWYGTQFHGRKTSSGEPYNMFAMTAAHPTLPLPTYAKVTNLLSGKSVVVKITDRGPFHPNRLIDLSYVAAAKLGILGHGTGYVEVVSIDPRDHQHKAQPLKPRLKPAPMLHQRKRVPQIANKSRR